MKYLITSEDKLKLIREVRHVLLRNGIKIELLSVEPETLREILESEEFFKLCHLGSDTMNEGEICGIPFQQVDSVAS